MNTRVATFTDCLKSRRGSFFLQHFTLLDFSIDMCDLLMKFWNGFLYITTSDSKQPTIPSQIYLSCEGQWP